MEVTRYLKKALKGNPEQNRGGWRILKEILQ